MPVSVVTINGCFLIEEGFRSVISAHDKFEFLHNISDESKIEEDLKKHQPSLLIVDPALTPLKKDNGSLSVYDASPHTALIFISLTYTPQTIKDYMALGVKVFLLYSSDKKDILDALNAAQKSKKFFCKGLLDVAIESMTQPDVSHTNLSEREHEIIRLLAKGLSSKEMREELSVSIHTINSHKKNIFRKLHINKASDLLLFALKNGLVEVGSA